MSVRSVLWAGVLYSCSFQTMAVESKKVQVDQVLHHDAGVKHLLSCIIAAPSSYRISSHASAELLNLLPVGSSVKKGQLVAQQDDRYLKAQVNIIKTDIEAARVAKSYANEEFNRFNRLSKTGLTAATELNNVKFQLDSSELKIQRLQQELQLAEANLSRLKHYAPFDAQVISVNSEPGSQLNAGQSILQLLSTQNKQLECALPVLVYSGGSALNQSRFALDGTEISLREVSQKLDARSENLTLYFDHPAKDRSHLLVGQIQHIDMTVFSERITKVPSDAIELEANSYLSWRVLDGKVQRIEVKILDTLPSHYVVDSQLRPGDAVVVRGQHGLEPGELVDADSRLAGNRTAPPYE